ncbi:dynein intermediate [Cyclospora cayetanensis]|uniref:Dynein intermediate n=1 Tax=Cyclospora cayetanensis TaxID=88456 RepID=A0A1D3CXB8_9EIME|nr:dynein intermediate [Cyclospora cayetanensis]
MPPNTLYPKNPRAPQNITRFSFKENQFKKEGDVDQTVFHLSIESTLLLKDSAEATEQEELLRLRKEAAELRKELEAVEVSIEDDGLNRWIICDAYAKEAEMQNRKESELKPRIRHPLSLLPHDPLKSLMGSEKFRWSLKVLERVVSFIAQLEAYREFQATDEDACDTSLSVTPIWELRLPRIKGKDAMALQWNPYYHDLLAVGFGNYEYVQQGTGYVCCFSLKNTSHPEYFWKLDSKVCSLDWHPLRPSLLCVGLYDGNVAVLDATAPSKRPWHLSTVKTGKHIDPVWGVRWDVDTSTSQLSFISVSADGCVMRWTLLKNKLESEVPISDVAWAPYSSTQFAVLTTSGMVRPDTGIAYQLVAPTKCSEISAFVEGHWHQPTGGSVTIVKLPQRLVTIPEPTAEVGLLSAEAWQAERLTSVLLLISEEFREAAKPKDRSMRDSKLTCQGLEKEAPHSARQED